MPLKNLLKSKSWGNTSQKRKKFMVYSSGQSNYSGNPPKCYCEIDQFRTLPKKKNLDS